MSNFTFRAAIRTQTPILLGLAGPSRSGKTKSALRIATGLSQGQPIFMIDTESGRGLHYAEQHSYQYGTLDAPFTSERYTEAIEDAKKAGARVIIVDSASHEHEGPGGMLEQHEAFLDRTCGTDYKKRERMTFTAWIAPKAAHNKFVNRLLQMGADTHFIFCFRAKDKLKLSKGQEPIHVGWTPICSSRFEFEMTSLLVLPEGSQGTPDLEAVSSGLREPFNEFIKPGVQLDEKLGKRLAEWSTGAKPTESTPRSAAEPSPAEPSPQSALPGAGADLITTDQVIELGDLIKDAGVAREKLLARAGVASLSLLPAAKYADLKTALRQRIADRGPA